MLLPGQSVGNKVEGDGAAAHPAAREGQHKSAKTAGRKSLIVSLELPYSLSDNIGIKPCCPSFNSAKSHELGPSIKSNGDLSGLATPLLRCDDQSSLCSTTPFYHQLMGSPV